MLAASLLFCLAHFAGAPAAHALQDTSIEEIAKVDPYTKGDRAAMERMGYVSFGPFPWAEEHGSEDIREALGGIDMVFIETAHFRLASTLGTYKLEGDVIERKLVEGEMAALKKLNSKIKPQQKLDPWLRAHLYAYRLEQLYADFCKRFGVRADDFTELEKKAKAGRFCGSGPYLGQKSKFTVLLTQTRSAFGRYARHFLKVDSEHSHRYGFKDGYFYGASFESLKDHGRDVDVALYTSLACAMTLNFLDAFRESYQTVPEWFRYGLAHGCGRRIDSRWNEWSAGGSTSPDDDKSLEWQPRVWGLVKNEACLSWEEMTRWKSVDELKSRDHLIAWSRVDWVLDQKADTLREWLFAVTEPVLGEGDERVKAILAQAERASTTCWKQTPAELDQAWRAWVLKTYARK